MPERDVLGPPHRDCVRAVLLRVIVAPIVGVHQRVRVTAPFRAVRGGARLHVRGGLCIHMKDRGVVLFIGT